MIRAMPEQNAVKPPQKEKLSRDFWYFRFGQVVSVIGDSCGTIALAWWILEKTGSATSMSKVLAPAMVVQLFLLPLFGPIADRLPRKWILFFSDLWRGIMILILAAFVAFDFYEPWIVVSIYVLSSIGSALFRSASSGIVPQLVPKERLQEAIQRTHAIDAIGFILGGMIGGVVVSVIGAGGAFALDGLSFFCAAIATFAIRSETRPAQSVAQSGSALKAWGRDLSAGFRFIYGVPVLFWLCVVAMLMNFTFAPLSVLLPVLAKQAKAMPPWFLGALESSIGLGTVLGAVAVSRVSRRLTKDWIVVGGIALAGLGVVVLPHMPSLVPPLIALLALGVGGSFANIALGTQIAVTVPDDFRGRMGSIMGFMCGGIAPVGVAVSGILVERLGLTASLMAMGGMLLALTPLLFLVPRFTEFMRSDKQIVSIR